MGLFIGITKISENGDSAQYEFGPAESPENRGVLRIDKATGEVLLVQDLPNDSGNRMYHRAARKVTVAWKQGDYPDRMCWAS